jgi:hypothetical protein
MTNQATLECDDLGEALREDRPLRPARGYRIRYAQGDLNFRELIVADPVPLGRQILTSAGVDPGDGYSLFAILPTGDFEDVRLDEPFDLRVKGAERFIGFLTDRDFKLTLRDHQLEWGKPILSGTILYALAKPGEGEAVFLEVRGGQDRLIQPSDLIDLTAPGIERFIVAPKPALKYEITINGRAYIVNEARVTFEQIVKLAFPEPPGPNIEFSMTYRHAESKPHAGDLGPGGVVEVKPKGTVFNVTPTDKS